MLIASVLATLLIGYYYNDPFVYRDSFHILRSVLYLGVPLVLNAFYFRIPWTNLGFSKPVVSKKVARSVVAILLLLPLFIFLVRLDPKYLSEYSLYQSNQISFSAKLLQWSAFTFSTLIGWEILLRGYLLFGLRHLLSENYRVKFEVASLIAILWVTSTETLYHFVKPDLEAIGMLIVSPVLSWIAFRTKSLWIAMALHLYIEAVFIFAIIR